MITADKGMAQIGGKNNLIWAQHERIWEPGADSADRRVLSRRQLLREPFIEDP